MGEGGRIRREPEVDVSLEECAREADVVPRATPEDGHSGQWAWERHNGDEDADAASHHNGHQNLGGQLSGMRVEGDYVKVVVASQWQHVT